MLKGMSAAPVPVLLVIASFLCPTELSLYLEGLRLPPHRIALIVLFPFALLRLLTNRSIRIAGYDIFFLLFAAWTIGVFTYHTDGGKEGLVYGGSLALESLGGYLIARAFVRDEKQFTASLKVVIAAIVVAALIALPETLLGQIFTHDLLRSLTGYHHPTGVETRLGLTRAYGTFDHPIHYGTFCAALLALMWFAERQGARRKGKAALVSFATFLGISSAPMLCLGLQGGMLVWDRATRRIAARGWITVAVLVGLYLGASMVATRSPIAFVATGMTLDPWTGFYRLQIWEHGLENVWANPWTGIGLGDWVRPWWMVSATVDAFWLVIAMREGIPAFLLVATAILLLARGILKGRLLHADRHVRRIGLGWMMSLIALILIGCTVHYWNVLHAYFFFFLGLGGWIADPTRAARMAAGVAQTTASARSRQRPRLRGIQPVRPAVGGGSIGQPVPVAHAAV